MESPQGSPAQPRIASFAAELIDEILHHLVVDLSAYYASDSPKIQQLQAASLISRNWRGPAQRRLMDRLTISSGSHAKRVAEGFVASGLDVYVKELKILFSSNLRERSADTVDEPTSDQITAADGVGRDDFLALLPHFPTLTSLHLYNPTFSHFRPSDIDALRSSFIFPRLTSLHITTGRCHRDTDLVHTVLSLTPSLTTLSLYSDGSGTILPPSSRSPVELPRLKSLSLEGGTYPSSLVQLGILATSTITQVEDLFWSDDDSSNPSAQPLLRIMGSSLKSLGYTTYDGDSRDMAGELQWCTVLERLHLNLANGVPDSLLGSLPPTIHTLTLTDLDTAHELLVNKFASRSPSLKTIKLDAEFLDQDRDEEEEHYAELEIREFKEIVDTLKDTGVELVGLTSDQQEVSMSCIPEGSAESRDPLKMASLGPAPPAITTFAPELIDEILDHLIVALQSSPTYYTGLKSLGPYALISQTWRGPVQRRTMSRLVIKTEGEADWVPSELVTSGLNLLVKTLRIGDRQTPWDSWKDSRRTSEPADFTSEAANGISPRDNFLALLPLFPNITFLHLDPPFKRFLIPDVIIQQSLPILHQLTNLTLETRRGSRDIELVRSLLFLTPNLLNKPLPGLLEHLPGSLESITVPSVEQAYWLLKELTEPPAALKMVTIDRQVTGDFALFMDEELLLGVLGDACRMGDIKLIGAEGLARLRKLADEGQHPKFFYIGCSDSRVPEELIMDAKFGMLFAERNVANQFLDTDPDAEAVLAYAVHDLKVQHIVVVGHYG
ncbi:hypothetical protein RQP46_006208 [Phenoliferia psychrophenolica]